MDYNLEIERLSSIHLPGEELIIFQQPIGGGEEIQIKSSFSSADASEFAIVASSATYKDQGFTNAVPVSVIELKSMLVDCVESDQPMNIYDHPRFKDTRKTILEEVKDFMQLTFSGALLLEKDTVTNFSNGLGVIYENDKMIGVFESFTLDTNVRDYAVELEGVLFSNAGQDLNGVTVKCEYYDLVNNKKLTFKATAKPYSIKSFDGFSVEEYTSVDDSAPIVELIKEAIKVPFVEGAGADFINEQKYTEYRNSRMSVISEVRVKERKKAITSKFSDIDLF